MAYSPRFGANILHAARKLHDNRAVAEASGDGTLRYSSAILCQYQNLAIRDIIREQYLQHQEKLIKVMPEMVIESADITLSSGLGTLPTDCWVVLEAAKSDYSIYYTKIDQDVLKVKASRDPLLAPSSSKPAFYQIGLQIQVLPTSVTGPARAFYVRQPADVATDAAGEVPLANVWDGEIVRRMVQYGLADAKSSIAV